MSIGKFFDARYRQQKNIFGEKPIDLVEKVAKMLPPGAEVLELGVGEGRNALFLARQGFSVLGIDAAPTAIERLEEEAKKEHLPLRGKVADISHYQFHQHFDLILAIGLLHFLSQEIGHQLIARMKAATKPGGFNIVAALAEQHPFNPKPHVYSHGELKKLYADWKILVYEEVLGHFHGMAAHLGQQPNLPRPRVAKILAQHP